MCGIRKFEVTKKCVGEQMIARVCVCLVYVCVCVWLCVFDVVAIFRAIVV